MASFAQRRSSGLGVRTPQGGRTPSQHSRRSSQASVGSPATATHMDAGISDLTGAAGGGLGASLADELEDGWDGEEEGMEGADEEFYDEEEEGYGTAQPSVHGSPAKSTRQTNGYPDDAMGVDGGNDDNDDDDETAASPLKVSPYLEKCMSEVEALAGSHTDGGPSQQQQQDSIIWDRALTALRELPPQTRLDGASERLKAASKRASEGLEQAIAEWPHVTRAIMTPYQSSWKLVDWDDREEIITLVAATLDSLPHLLPLNLLTAAVEGVQELNAQNAEVMLALGSITDQTQVQAQASTKAAHRLRATRDVVAALRRDLDAGQEGQDWLEKGGWHARIQAREAASICRDVVSGFDDVCNRWRDRLVQQAGGVDGPAAATTGTATTPTRSSTPIDAPAG